MNDCATDPAIDAICIGEGAGAIVQLYQKAQGKRWTGRAAPFDFAGRVLRKGTTRLVGAAGAKVVHKLPHRLQTGDSRVVASLKGQRERSP